MTDATRDFPQHNHPHDVKTCDGCAARRAFYDTVADRTWRLGFLHLTVDHTGLVSLWDYEVVVDSYLRLPLTEEQRRLIEETMVKGGHTP